MGKPPAFQFYPSDFLTGTTFMSHAEVGGYVRLLCHQWDKGPLEKEPVMNILAPLSDTEIKTVLSKFRAKNGKYFNQRLATERKKFNDYKRQQRLNAQKRWGKHQNLMIPPQCQRIPMAMRPQCQRVCQTHALHLHLHFHLQLIKKRKILKRKVQPNGQKILNLPKPDAPMPTTRGFLMSKRRGTNLRITTRRKAMLMLTGMQRGERGSIRPTKRKWGASDDHGSMPVSTESPWQRV